jgi:hypothetical protein
MKLENQTILIFSNEAWGDIWYSKHNWAFELSKKNKVFFINPPGKWQLNNLLLRVSTFNYSKNLTILSYNNILPFSRFNLIFKINNFFVSKLLKKWLHKIKVSNYIFWTFDPYRFTNPNLLSPLFSIYFIADKYQTKHEKEVIKNVDFLISVSKSLTSHLPINKTLNLSHGISESEFEPDVNADEEEAYVLYIGNIDFRLDYPLIKKMATSFPNEKFLFIGQKIIDTNLESFKEIFIENKYPNIYYHLPVHFKKLKNYISKAKICIAPMLMEIHGNNINHHKILQYLALGKPILSPSFIDYENNNLIYTYKNHEECIKQLKNVLNNNENSNLINARINFAQQFTYDNLIKKVEDFISNEK